MLFILVIILCLNSALYEFFYAFFYYFQNTSITATTTISIPPNGGTMTAKSEIQADKKGHQRNKCMLAQFWTISVLRTPPDFFKLDFFKLNFQLELAEI
jgi:hypothetical protein